jgi:hypothetical protein
MGGAVFFSFRLCVWEATFFHTVMRLVVHVGANASKATSGPELRTAHCVCVFVYALAGPFKLRYMVPQRRSDEALVKKSCFCSAYLYAAS